MKYLAEGRIKRKGGHKFELKIDAKSKKHAMDIAIVKIGSKQGIKKNSIEIKEIKEIEDEK